MNAANSRVVIVGAGIIGTACAYYLSKSGRTVTLVDAGSFGQGCSHANCGLVSPSHVLPLAEPGAVRQALRAMFASRSPFYIKPRFDPALWQWLVQFARRCNHADMLEAGRAIQALLGSSRRLYDELMQSEPLKCEWETRGLLYVYRSKEAMEAYAATDQLLQNEFNVSARRYDADALLQLEPALKPDMAGGWFYPSDAHLRPDKLLTSWRRILEANGVQIKEHCPMAGFIRSGRAATAICSESVDIPADAFVIATGALTPHLSRDLGCRTPIQPGKGYSITMSRPALCPSLPLLFPEHRLAVTPMQSGFRLGSTMEFAGYDSTLNRRRLDILRQGACHYLREPYGPAVEEEWFGWRPMTYDGKPIIDHSPELANVIIAAGHNMLGLSMAPATGKLVAELLNGDPPHIDPAPYSVRRFN
jgi:D-amino-acid dehydrogenase